MTRTAPFSSLLAVAGLCSLAAAVQSQDSAQPAAVPIRFGFRLEPGMPGPEITMRIATLGQKEVRVAMPVWKPGHYTLENYSRYVKELKAADAAGKALETAQPDKHTWTIAAGEATEVVVTYRVQPPRGGGVGPAKTTEDKKRIYKAYQFDGPETWLYLPDRLGAAHEVTFALPSGWKVATGILPTADPLRFGCADYDTFADCPFRVGEFEERTFTVEGVPHRIVWSGFEADEHDRDEVAKRYERMVKAQVAMMGKPPYPFYVFLMTSPGGAGLEHLNSTAISMMSLEGSSPGNNSIWDSLVSHEFFHLWNVKRLRPSALGPFDYSGPNRTKYLWVSEGITSYYGDLLLVRAGIWEEKLYWSQAITNEINTLQRNPGRLRMSVAEASRTVWDGPYMGRRGVPDYYNKGQLLGLLLDIEIRDATDGRKSLDDVMRALYAQCMTTGKGFADGDVQKACETLTEHSFAEFFAKYVDGVEELPFRACLAKIGIELVETGVKPATESQPASAQTRRRRPEPAFALRIDPKASERATRLRTEMMKASAQ